MRSNHEWFLYCYLELPILCVCRAKYTHTHTANYRSMQTVEESSNYRWECCFAIRDNRQTTSAVLTFDDDDDDCFRETLSFELKFVKTKHVAYCVQSFGWHRTAANKTVRHKPFNYWQTRPGRLTGNRHTMAAQTLFVGIGLCNILERQSRAETIVIRGT